MRICIELGGTGISPRTKVPPAKSAPGKRTPGQKHPRTKIPPGPAKSGDIFYCSGRRQLNYSSWDLVWRRPSSLASVTHQLPLHSLDELYHLNSGIKSLSRPVFRQRLKTVSFVIFRIRSHSPFTRLSPLPSLVDLSLVFATVFKSLKTNFACNSAI